MEFLLATPSQARRRDPITAALAGLGMSVSAAADFAHALTAPEGLLLIAGAVGSGRTTTIQTAERLSLGHNPLIAGEIDDAASADRALQAAVSGRLVIATMESGDAVGAIMRLKALRGDPFLVASALRAVFGQRLARRLCQICREPVQASRDSSARLGFDPGVIVHQPAGCPACDGTGYGGHIGLFEAIPVDAVMRRLIERGDAPLIAGQAFRDRPDLGGAARAMVREGSISTEDALLLSRATH